MVNIDVFDFILEEWKVVMYSTHSDENPVFGVFNTGVSNFHQIHQMV